MFRNDIKNCMSGDPSLNVLITGDIRHCNLPVNKLSSDSWIKYTYTKIDSEDETNSSDAVVRYKLNILIIAPDEEDVANIFNELDNYLINYDDGAIRTISFESGDDIEYDETLKTRYCSAEYTILYVK